MINNTIYFYCRSPFLLGIYWLKNKQDGWSVFWGERASAADLWGIIEVRGGHPPHWWVNLCQLPPGAEVSAATHGGTLQGQQQCTSKY